MTFTEAISAAFKDGDRITRAIWATRTVYAQVEDGHLYIKGVPDDGKFHPWVISEQDFFAHDWEVIADA